MSSENFKAQKKRAGRFLEPSETVPATFGAVVGGLYAVVQREALTQQIMLSLFGEGWGFADLLAMLVAPALSIFLIPLSAALGAASAVWLVRWLKPLFLR